MYNIAQLTSISLEQCHSLENSAAQAGGGMVLGSASMVYLETCHSPTTQLLEVVGLLWLAVILL